MLDFFRDNWLEVLVAVNTIALGANALAKLTPTKWDDRIIGYVLRALSFGLAGRK